MFPQPYLKGVPPPPLNPPGGTGWMSPYYPAPMYDTSVPTFVHHVTPPTPSAANNNNGNGTGKSGNNRNSPAPPPHHMSHPPVSNSGYCQNHSPVQSVNNSGGMQQQQQHVVSYHLQQGEVISIQLGDGQVEVIQGRTSIFSI